MSLVANQAEIRVVVGLVVAHQQGGGHVVARLTGGGLGQTGAAAIQTGQLDHAGAQHTGITLVLAGQRQGQSAGLHVGGGAHGRPLGRAGEPVGHQSTVARGVHIRQVGAQLAVHRDGSLDHLQAAALQKSGVGTDARAHHHHIGRQSARLGLHGGDPAVAQNDLGRGAGHHPDAGRLQLLAGKAGHFLIQHAGHDLARHVEYRHIQPLSQQVLRRLQADEAAADDHCVLGGVLLQIAAQSDGVVRGAQLEHALLGRALDGRDHAGRAGGNDQGIVFIGLGLTAGQVLGSHGLGRRVQAHGLPAGEHLGAGEGGVLLRGIHDQLVTGLNQAAHIIGQAAARVGDVPVLDQNGHIRGLILPFNFGSSLGTGGNAAQDQHLHCSSSCSLKSPVLLTVAVTAAAVGSAVAAAVVALALLVVMIAGHIAVHGQSALQQLLHHCVGAAGRACVYRDARLGQRLARAAADAAADQHLHTLGLQKARQRTVALAIGVHHLAAGDLLALGLIQLELLGVAKVLEYVAVFVSNRDFHSSSTSFTQRNGRPRAAKGPGPTAL